MNAKTNYVPMSWPLEKVLEHSLPSSLGVPTPEFLWNDSVTRGKAVHQAKLPFHTMHSVTLVVGHIIIELKQPSG